MAAKAKAEPVANLVTEETPTGPVETVKVKSPTGAVTEVPVGILDALLASGYSKTK